MMDDSITVKTRKWLVGADTYDIRSVFSFDGWRDGRARLSYIHVWIGIY